MRRRTLSWTSEVPDGVLGVTVFMPLDDGTVVEMFSRNADWVRKLKGPEYLISVPVDPSVGIALVVDDGTPDGTASEWLDSVPLAGMVAEGEFTADALANTPKPPTGEWRVAGEDVNVNIRVEGSDNSR